MGKLETESLSRLPRRKAPPHHRMHPQAFTGRMTLRLSTLDDDSLGLIPGTGSVVLYQVQNEQHTVESCARRQGRPIVPGTSLKGAFRTMYEMLTGSCNVTEFRARCQGYGRNEVCPACSLFGHLGYAGRLAFDDAVPEDDDAVRVRLIEVPVAWGPRRSHGSFRLYNGKPALGQDGAEPRDWVSTELYQGRFRCQVRFRNVEPQELGRLFLTLGLGGGDLSFFPKLGGKKFDGQGAVRIEVLGITLRHNQGLGGQQLHQGPDAATFVTDQIIKAQQDRSWKWNEVEPLLAKLATRLKEGY
jgi:hypothetical protein